MKRNKEQYLHTILLLARGVDFFLETRGGGVWLLVVRIDRVRIRSTYRFSSSQLLYTFLLLLQFFSKQEKLTLETRFLR